MASSIPQEVEQWWAREKAGFYNDVIQALLARVTPQERAEIQRLLGVRAATQAVVSAVEAVRVPVAPPVPSGAPVTVSPPASAYGTIDEAVGNPDVAVPPVAVRTSPFAQTIFSQTKPFVMPAISAGGVVPDFIQAQGTSVITFSGVIESSPQVLYVTYDGGQHWAALDGGQPFPQGSVFAYSLPVEAGDKVGFGTESQSEWDRFIIQIHNGVATTAPQGQFGAVPTAIPGATPYPSLFVPVSAYPIIIAKASNGTNITPGQPIGGSAYTAPAPGTVGVFGFIASGAAYFTLAIEKANGQLVYGSLNSASNQVQGAWFAATVAVDQGDTIAVSVSAPCTLGTVRVTYTPTT